MAGTLYTNGARINKIAAAFDAYDFIRYSAKYPDAAVALGITDSAKVDLSDELGIVLARIYVTDAGSNITTGGGNDIFKGGAGVDLFNSGAGNDRIDGGSGNDIINGGDGDDYIDGKYDNDVIRGGAGSDTIVDQGGTTRNIDGGAGNDLIYARRYDTAGTDFSGTIDGGAGIDRLYFGGDFKDVEVTNVEILETSGSKVFGTAAQFETFEHIIHTAGSTDPSDRVYLTLTAGGPLNLSAQLDFQGAIISASAAGNAIISGRGNDTLQGHIGNDRLSGAAGNDSITGYDGDDLLSGGNGNDAMNGGNGNDSFLFNTTLNDQENVDSISYFVPSDDTIQLDDAVFKAFRPGAITAADFHVGTSATTASQNLIYDSGTGNLFYDADGSGAGAQTLFAKVDAGVKLTSADFKIV